MTVAADDINEIGNPLDTYKDVDLLFRETDQLIPSSNKESFKRSVSLTQRKLTFGLREEIEKYVKPDRILDFRLCSAGAGDDSIEFMLEECIKFIDEENTREFKRQITLKLGEYIGELGQKVRDYSNERWAEVRKLWLDLRNKIAVLKRRLDLLIISSEEEFNKTLWYMAECGREKDLDLIRKIRDNGRYPKNSEGLLRMVDERICRRVYDPEEVLLRGEEAYQRHKQEWDEKYKGQYIAIHGSEFFDNDIDKSKLVGRIIERQKREGPFRVYIVEVGAPLLEVMGPRVRL